MKRPNAANRLRSVLRSIDEARETVEQARDNLVHLAETSPTVVKLLNGFWNAGGVTEQDFATWLATEDRSASIPVRRFLRLVVRNQPPEPKKPPLPHQPRAA